MITLNMIVCQPTRALRSEDLQLLKAPRIRTKTYGKRRFDTSAATLWNSLPQNSE